MDVNPGRQCSSFLQSVAGCTRRIDQCVLSWTDHIMKMSLDQMGCLVSLSDEDMWVTASRVFPREPHLTAIQTVVSRKFYLWLGND